GGLRHGGPGGQRQNQFMVARERVILFHFRLLSSPCPDSQFIFCSSACEQRASHCQNAEQASTLLCPGVAQSNCPIKKGAQIFIKRVLTIDPYARSSVVAGSLTAEREGYSTLCFQARLASAGRCRSIV